MEMYFIQKAQLDICLEYNAMLIPTEQYEVFEEVSKNVHLNKLCLYFYHEQYFAICISK
jgi:hypothetical protein